MSVFFPVPYEWKPTHKDSKDLKNFHKLIEQYMAVMRNKVLKDDSAVIPESNEIHPKIYDLIAVKISKLPRSLKLKREGKTPMDHITICGAKVTRGIL